LKFDPFILGAVLARLRDSELSSESDEKLLEEDLSLD
jgi:hypothetical protein